MLQKFILSGIVGFAMLLGQANAETTVVVGGKKFTEQQVIAEMTNQLLKDNGFKVDKRVDLGSSVLRAAQENGQIDVYWEYTGTSLVTYNKILERLNAIDTYNKVKELDAAKGLTWLDPSKANNTYGLAMRKAEAEALGIKTLSDLARVVNEGKALKFASNAEFYSRADGLRPLQEMYEFEFPRKDVTRMDGGLTYQALKDEQVNVALILATDGRIGAFDFVVIEDDKGFFPSYALTPVIRTEMAEKNPELVQLLNNLSAKLDDVTMIELNKKVDVGRESIEDVSNQFLKANNLVK